LGAGVGIIVKVTHPLIVELAYYFIFYILNYNFVIRLAANLPILII